MVISNTKGTATPTAAATQQPSTEAMAKRIAELERALAEANEPRALSAKVTEKGGISLYGLGRFPVTLYVSQWMAIAKNLGVVMNCATKNFEKCSFNNESSQAAAKAWLES